MWNYIQEKYLIPNEGRKWSMETMDVAWRRFKWETKKKVLSGKEDETDRPKIVPDNQLEDLVVYWNVPKIQEQSEKNKRNRQFLDDLHTMGLSSYAMLRHKLEQEDPNKQEPSQSKVYKQSRKRNPKNAYKISYSKTKANMEKMEALETQQHEGGANKDPYYEVITKPEHSG